MFDEISDVSFLTLVSGGVINAEGHKPCNMLDHGRLMDALMIMSGLAAKIRTYLAVCAGGQEDQDYKKAMGFGSSQQVLSARIFLGAAWLGVLALDEHGKLEKSILPAANKVHRDLEELDEELTRVEIHKYLDEKQTKHLHALFDRFPESVKDDLHWMGLGSEEEEK